MTAARERLRRILADCYCRLQPSPIHGVGVFALRPIPGRRNPFRTPRTTPTGAQRLTPEHMAALPPALLETIQALFIPMDGATCIPSHGLNIVPLSAYLNHSAAPNLQTKDGSTFTTLRKIAAGEELTVDYRTYLPAGYGGFCRR